MQLLVVNINFIFSFTMEKGCLQLVWLHFAMSLHALPLNRVSTLADVIGTKSIAVTSLEGHEASLLIAGG